MSDPFSKEKIEGLLVGLAESLWADPVIGRANTDEEKRQVLDLVYKIWTSNPGLSAMRLGQLLVNACPNRPLFSREDYALVSDLTNLQVRLSGECRKVLECGGVCHRPENHPGPCECVGDDPGKPGTCPA